MSEMLGNQYFMARKFAAAEPLLEKVLSTTSNLKAVKRKLIICYALNNKMDKSFVLFYEMINNDIDFILSADPVYDDCPCPELIASDLIDDPGKGNAADILKAGIIWLFCDIKNSLYYFEEAIAGGESDNRIVSIVEMLKKRINLMSLNSSSI